MIKTWLKIFYRNSKKNSLNLIINILGLTLGFAGLMFVLLYINDEKSYNAWNPNKDNIYRVTHRMADGYPLASSTKIEGKVFKEEIPEVVGYYMTGGSYRSRLVKINDKGIFTKGILTGKSNFFDFFPFQIIEGSTERFKESRSHIAISDELAKLYFKDESALDKTISMRGDTYIITTVFIPNKKSYFSPKLVIQYKKEQTSNWGSFSNTLFCRLTGNVNPKDVESKMDDIFDKYSFIPSAEKNGISLEEYKEKSGLNVKLENLMGIRLYTKSSGAGPEGKGNYSLILIMIGLSTLLIIISCVNFINLSTASIGHRYKEIGVKKALGLHKKTIVIHYIFEILFQGFIAFVVSLFLVELLLPYFNVFMGKELNLLNGSVIFNIGLVV
ncbi:MAG: ABC transporter permease [Flavobacteriaceae bacterium]|nr:ABC transporter permease [Flavobacteriaceae bacterium]